MTTSFFDEKGRTLIAFNADFQSSKDWTNPANGWFFARMDWENKRCCVS